MMIESDSDSYLNADVIQPDMARVLAAESEAKRLKIAWGIWRVARPLGLRNL